MLSWQVTIGILLGPLIGALAWRAGSLSRSGALAASVVGALVFGFGGIPWAAALLAFFISSSGLSRIFRRQKVKVSEKFAKGSRRDWGQVAANGGLGASLAFLLIFFPGLDLLWVAFLGAMAAVNADTWGTELGVLSRSAPRLITSGRVVDPGSSGAISPLGLGASLAGAFFVAGLGTLFRDFNTIHLLSATLAGFSASLFDSLLGATIQAIYRCPLDGMETEQHPFHRCGTKTVLLRGLPWLNNDVVNFAASIVGALLSISIWTLLV